MARKKKLIINDFERSSQTYFTDISNLNPLSREEEFSLWEQYKKHNDLSARDKIIKSNLKFVASVAKPYIGRGLSYSDLIAEGNIGLMKAMDRFDYEKGYKTISYSVWWIRQTILEALESRNSLKSVELPSDFEKPVENDDNDTFIPLDKSSDENYMIEPIGEDNVKRSVEIVIGCLTPKERTVISNYFGLDGNDELTLEEIGQKLGLTKERVRQIKERALKKMRAEALNNYITSDIY